MKLSCGKQRISGWPRIIAKMKTIAGRANLIGTYEIFYGDYKRLYSKTRTVIEKVTVDDVQHAAQTLFPEKNRTVGALIPRG